MDLWWKCPNCKKKVDFKNEMDFVFDDENGEADFSPKHGLPYHTVFCECGDYWTISISPMYIFKQPKN
jgi:hypothetical protein